jgi:hypothetical protein
MMCAVDRSSSLARINDLAVVWRFRLSQARGLSSVNPKLWVRWKYVRRRCSSELGRYVSTIRCHVPGFARSFGLGPWIADVRGG